MDAGLVDVAMQVALRGLRGLGQSGETDYEGGTLPGGTIESPGSGSGEGGFFVYTQTDPIPFGTPADCADLSLWASVQARNAACYPLVTGAPTAPGGELTGAELEAEQIRARSWLSQLNLPSVLTAGTKVALTAAQIAQGLQAGAIKRSSTCSSGYMVAGTANCIDAASAVGIGPGQQLIQGVSNQVIYLGLGLLAFLIILKPGTRR